MAWPTFPAGIEFTFQVSREIQSTGKELALGDGYVYRTQFGLHPFEETVRGQLFIAPAAAETVRTFLEARAADGLPFLWVPLWASAGECATLWTIEEWPISRAFLGKVTMDLALKRRFDYVTGEADPEGPEPPAPTDPYFSSVVLLIQPDAEADNSTVFTDLSSYGRALTTQGGAKISTSVTRFGKPTIQTDGTVDGISIADSSSLELSNSDFTLEVWLEPFTQTRQYATLISRTNNVYIAGTWILLANYTSSTSGDLLFYVQNNYILQTTGVNVRDGDPHFIQVARSGNSFTLNVDGVQRASATSSIVFDNSTFPLKIFNDDGSSPTRDVAGNVGAVRLTIGVARANVVPTAPFPTS